MFEFAGSMNISYESARNKHLASNPIDRAKFEKNPFLNWGASFCAKNAKFGI